LTRERFTRDESFYRADMFRLVPKDPPTNLPPRARMERNIDLAGSILTSDFMIPVPSMIRAIRPSALKVSPPGESRTRSVNLPRSIAIITYLSNIVSGVKIVLSLRTSLTAPVAHPAWQIPHPMQ